MVSLTHLLETLSPSFFSVGNGQMNAFTIYARKTQLRPYKSRITGIQFIYRHCEPRVRTHLPSDLQKIFQCHFEHEGVDRARIIQIFIVDSA